MTGSVPVPSLPDSFPAAPRRERPAQFAVYVALAALTLSPLLWVSVPPLVDYPNHLARMWILVQGGKNAELASNYVVHWRLLPNLAMDLIVPALARVMPLEMAGRLFIAWIMLGLLGGTIALQRALHGRVGLWPVCCLIFVYNAALGWGFLNFLFGVGIFLVSFSGWIASRDWKLLPRIVIFSGIATLLMVFHLFAFALYGLAVACYELAGRVEGWPLSRKTLISWCLSCTQFVVPVLLWAASASNGGPLYTSYGHLKDKAFALASPVMFDPAPINRPDGIDVLIFICCGALFLVALASRSLRMAPRMGLPVAAMILAAIVMPNWLSGSWAADIRLPVTLPFVIIGSTRIVSRRRWWPLGVICVAMTALLMARVWTVTEAWRDYERQLAELRSATRAIPEGSRLLVVVAPVPEERRRLDGLPVELARRWEPIYSNLPALAVIDRSAFIPYLFTGWTPVAAAPRNAGMLQSQAVPISPVQLSESPEEIEAEARSADSFSWRLGEPPYWRDWRAKVDCVLWLDFGNTAQARLPELEPIAAGSFFHIYRVVRG